jgi:hypothetical protein
MFPFMPLTISALLGRAFLLSSAEAATIIPDVQ